MFILFAVAFSIALSANLYYWLRILSMRLHRVERAIIGLELWLKLWGILVLLAGLSWFDLVMPKAFFPGRNWLAESVLIMAACSHFLFAGMFRHAGMERDLYQATVGPGWICSFGAKRYLERGEKLMQNAPFGWLVRILGLDWWQPIEEDE